ncbi:MAG TPA: hypothetical protein VIQ30_27150 [Pseudonocardia sp.]|jgi:hypothetical protein
MADPVVRLTANVSPAVADELDSLAKLLGTNKTQALNQAIVTASALYKAQEVDGGTVLVQKGKTQEVVELPTVKK